MADVLNFNANRAFDINGDPVPGAMAYFFGSGTGGSMTVYADIGASVAHPSPLVADGQGVFPPVYVSGGEGVSVEVTDEFGVMLDGYPMPVAISVPASGANASSVAFDPTADIPERTVQEAIERVQANLVAPVAAFGLGVTGNAPQLQNINALDIASGMYRYEGTTTGTFPAGVVAENGGEITLWRRNNNSAVMVLYPSNADGIFARRLASGVWQSWTNYVTVDNVDTRINETTAGRGQELRDVTSSRSGNTIYQNTTDAPIGVWILPRNENLGDIQMSPARTGFITLGNSVDNGRNYQYMLVPVGWFYRTTGGGSAESWKELR